MKKFLTYFFVTLGIVFFIIICSLAYLWFADPFGIRPMIDAFTATHNEGEILQKDKNPILSDEQEKALEKIGIDASSLPTEITPEMEKCFVEKLGASRVIEIKNGDEPSVKEVFITRECYN